MPKILLVDDDPQALESTRKILEFSSYEVVTACDGEQALGLVRAHSSPIFDLVITDVRMPKMGGLEFLRALSALSQEMPVILMTAFGKVEDAVLAMKLGAVDFLTKPFKRQALLSSVEATLKRARKVGRSGGGLIGSSEAMQRLRGMIAQVAPTSATVLLTGESGTGKELVAHCIHEQSRRAAGGKFIAINCAAVPETLIESELFGFEKGAFTGATASKGGLFEAADGGTLLLDEMGDMPLALQAKLLRVLQEGEVRRVGSSTSKKVDVRVIAATHRDLNERVKAGFFRQDLLYRLEVIGIHVAPLRERKEDITELVYHFLSEAGKRHGKSIESVSENAMAVLLSHSWPGNVRELSNVIERAVVFMRSGSVGIEDLPPHFASAAGASGTVAGSSISIPIGTPLRDVEDLLIRKTLEATDGDKNMTAKLLGINSRTIYRKLDKTT